MLSKMIWPQIEDEQVKLKRELKHRRKELDTIDQLRHRLYSEYTTMKRHYEIVDKRRALIDGRLRVVVSNVTPKTSPKHLTQEQVNSLIEELENMI